MAVSLKFALVPSQNALSFFFVETTGAYNPVNNTGGWGTPNEDISAATDATLTITKSDDTTVSFGAADNFFPLFPNTNSAPFEITNVMLGLSADEQITDWIAYITYNVNAVSPYVTSMYLPVLSQSECCVAGLSTRVTVENDCNCDNAALAVYSDAYDLLQTIKYALTDTCQSPAKATEILSRLSDICNSSNCGCN
jgi:hypothetical protein